MPIVICPALRAAARFGLCLTVLFFFMAGLLLHFECVSIGSLSHPAGSRPSHSISVRNGVSLRHFDTGPGGRAGLADALFQALRERAKGVAAGIANITRGSGPAR